MAANNIQQLGLHYGTMDSIAIPLGFLSQLYLSNGELVEEHSLLIHSFNTPGSVEIINCLLDKPFWIFYLKLVTHHSCFLMLFLFTVGLTPASSNLSKTSQFVPYLLASKEQNVIRWWSLSSFSHVKLGCCNPPSLPPPLLLLSASFYINPHGFLSKCSTLLILLQTQFVFPYLE